MVVRYTFLLTLLLSCAVLSAEGGEWTEDQLLLRGSLLLRSGRAEEALPLLKEAVRIQEASGTSPYSARATVYSSTGECLAALQRYPEARGYAQKASLLFLQAGQSAEAVTPLTLEGDLLCKLGEPAAAEQVLLQAVSLSEEHGLERELRGAAVRLAKLYREEGRSAEQVQYAQKSLRRVPRQFMELEDYTAADLLGCGYLSLGEAEKALSAFHLALKFAQSNHRYDLDIIQYENIVTACLALGDLQRARLHALRAVSAADRLILSSGRLQVRSISREEARLLRERAYALEAKLFSDAGD